jgi:CBS domain-containing protein
MRVGTRSAAARRRRPAEIRVGEAMHRGVLRCSRDTPLSELAETMASRRVHSIVVTDVEPGGRDALWGVVSDLDLVAAASVRSLDEQYAGPSAATPALAIAPDETLLRAAQLMTEHASAHLVVVDGSGTPVGVLSTLDIARALAGMKRDRR